VEFKNYIIQIFESTPIIVETDVETKVFLRTFGLNVSIFEPIPLDPIGPLATTKQNL
jgi:hypothetical protein